ncbi:MAG: hypothetical protein Q7L19_00840 [Pseudohongiella sp.]|nr:hypothetical protein [Pseudohongiella sp.]
MRSKLYMLCPLALAGILVTSLHAAEEIRDNVPLDLVKALLGTNSPYDVRLYSGLPDSFPEFRIPDSAELLGSADMGHSQQVILRAQGDGMQQRSQIMTSLEDSGYLLLTQAPTANPAQTGFVTPLFIPPSMPVQFCHDEHGMLTIRITGANPTYVGNTPFGPRVLSLSSSQGPAYQPFLNSTSRATWVAGTSNAAMTDSIINVTATGGVNNSRAQMGAMDCQQMLAQFSGRGQPAPALMNINQYMPRMELPAAATLSPARGMGPSFTSGSLNGIESGVVMSIDWELGRLFRHFTDQIAQKDWLIDNQSVGDISATASWIREIDEMQFFGMLRVIKTADSHYRLQFSIQNLSAD